jgi:hypothetical protein
MIVGSECNSDDDDVETLSLLLLPRDFLILLITKYLVLADISNLDVAICSHRKHKSNNSNNNDSNSNNNSNDDRLEIRDILLELLSSKDVVFDKIILTRYQLIWMIERKISSKCITTKDIIVNKKSYLLDHYNENTYINDNDLYRLSKNINISISLVSLCISCCTLISDEGVKCIIDVSHNITHLDMSYCTRLTNLSAISIATLHKLKTLDISFCKRITIHGITEIIKSVDAISSLNIGGCAFDNSDSSIAIDDDLEEISSAKNLTLLNITRFDNITDKGLISLIKNCNHLNYLVLSWCNKITDIGIIAITNANLFELDISYCNKITNLGFMSIAKCVNLQSLVVGCVDQISDEAMIYVIKHCTKLKSIDTHYNNRISDLCLQEMSTLKYLEKLEMANCHNISSNGISYLVKNCTTLRILNFSWSERIDDDAMKHIGEYCDKLESLSIQQCQAITDNGLKQLQRLPNLKTLDIRYCYVISDKFVEELKSIRTDINIIDYPMISY